MKSLTSMACFLCLVFFAAGAAAGELREIELKDGSIITGDVLSLSGGIYTIKSESLGIIKLGEAKICTIRSKKPAGSAQQAGAAAGTAGDVRSLQEKMMSDEEIMGMIQSLQNDPDFQKLLEDPAVVKAVNAGDVAALMANPQFMKLLNNSTVHEIQKKIH